MWRPWFIGIQTAWPGFSLSVRDRGFSQQRDGDGSSLQASTVGTGHHVYRTSSKCFCYRWACDAGCLRSSFGQRSCSLQSRPAQPCYMLTASIRRWLRTVVSFSTALCLQRRYYVSQDLTEHLWHRIPFDVVAQPLALHSIQLASCLATLTMLLQFSQIQVVQ